MKAKIGSLYLAIRERSKYALFYSPVFMIRRILFVGLTVGLKNNASIQIHLFMFTSLFYLMYLGTVSPHTEIFVTKLEIVNETLFMLVSYQFMLYTDVLQNVPLRYSIGWSQVALVVFLLVINFCVIINANV